MQNLFLKEEIMPDLITHSVLVYTLRNRSVKSEELVLLIIGAILPDLVTRPFMIIFPPAKYFFHAFHTPVALILIILLISYLFEECYRAKVMKLLSLGVASHLFLDLFQYSVGNRGYSWFFPFSYFDFRIGLFMPEDSLYILPLLMIILGIDSYVYQNKKKK